MALVIQLPDDLEQSLRREFDNLDRAATEALLVELYRRDKLSHYDLGQALELDRFETDALLKEYNVTEDLPTVSELEDDLKRLSQLVRK